MEITELSFLKNTLDLYETGYETIVTNNDCVYIDHEKKCILLGGKECLLKLDDFIQQKIYEIIAEIHLYKRYPQLIDSLCKPINDNATLRISDALNEISFLHGITENRLARCKRKFMHRCILLDYSNHSHFKRWKQIYDVNALCFIAEHIVEKSGMDIKLSFVYKTIELDGGYPLGSYFLGEIEIYMGNILHVYLHKKMPASSIEELVQAITSHELGHGVKSEIDYQKKRKKNHSSIQNAIYQSNKQLFDDSFLQYIWNTFREEKRAWNEGSKFYFFDEFKGDFHSHKRFFLRRYIPYLSKQKNRWTKDYEERECKRKVVPI